MKYLSLFSGIGGFELGIKQAHDNIYSTKNISKTTNRKKESQEDGIKERQFKQLSQYSSIGLSCVGYSEIDKYAIQVYQKHFPNHKNHGDITKIKAEELLDFEFLCGGFPCQSFSIAGKRGGFNDTRGTLFFDIARILKVKQPRLLLLENVKGLLSHDEGRTFATIISTLDELGYDIQWQVLNSKNFGVPQNRERVFIIGHFRGTSRPKVFPITSNHKADFSGVSIIDGYNRKESKEIGAVRQNMLNGGSLINDSNRIRRPTYPTDRIRRLTPTECERLQGFSDEWTKYGINEKKEEVLISDHQVFTWGILYLMQLP